MKDGKDYQTESDTTEEKNYLMSIRKQIWLQITSNITLQIKKHAMQHFSTIIRLGTTTEILLITIFQITIILKRKI